MRRLGLVAALLLPAWSSVSARLPTADFLQLPTDVRTLGMGEAGQATASGAQGIMVNPAAVAAIALHELYFTHAFLAEGVGFDHLSYGFGRGGHHAAMTFQHVGYGTLEGRDNTGSVTSGFQPADDAYTFTYGRAYRGIIGGASVRHVQSKVADSASTWTFDFGGRYSPRHDLVVALSGTNLGGSLSYDTESAPLPAALKGGVSWEPERGWALNLDVARPFYGPAFVALGTEYGMNVKDVGRALLRLGFNTRNIDLGAFSGMKAGVGFIWRRVTVDYALSPLGDLGQAHMIGVSWRFGEAPR